MPTRPSSAEHDVVQDALRALQLARGRIKDFLALDAGSKVKAVTPDFLKKLEADLLAFEKMARTKSGRATLATRATEEEKALRAKLSEHMRVLRDAIRRRAPSDATLRKALGVGKDLSSQSTKALLRTADELLGALEEHAPALTPLGIGKKERALLEKARAALSKADVGQNTAIGARIDATAAKRAVLERIRTGLSRIREAARSLPGVRTATKAGAKAKAKAGAFASKAARRTPKKRAKTGKPATPSPST